MGVGVLGPVGMGAEAAGLGASLLGGAMKGDADQQALEARRQAALQNRQFAQAQAADALQRGAQQAGQLRTRGSQIIGTQRAGYGASGIDANSGTAAEVQASTRAISEVDAGMAMNNAARQAWGHQVSADQYGQEAELDQRAKREVGFGTLLGGIGQAASGTSGLASTYNKLF